LCVRNGFSVYFLGDTEEVVGGFAQQVQANHPELTIAGWHHGFFDPDSVDVVEAVATAGADIVITGMGMPRQEFWAFNVKDKIGKGVFIATGALFRWYTGIDRRAPKWVTECGLEWLARLVKNPTRHFRRYGIGIPRFYWRVLFGGSK